MARRSGAAVVSRGVQNAYSSKSTRMWLVFFMCWAILLSGFLDFWIQSPGLKQWYKVKSALREQRQDIADIEARTELLQNISKQLNSNPVAQEREIRKVLGYLGENELVFEF